MTLAFGKRCRQKSFTRAVGALALGLAFVAQPALSQPQIGPAAAPTVGVAPVALETVAETREFTGRVEAVQRVEIRARVDGYLEAVEFEDGGEVREGALLYEIEEAPYAAAVAQAAAQVASAEAQLAKAQATLANAEQNLERQRTLVERQTVSEAVFLDAQAQRDAAAADVEAAKAQIALAQANETSARLNLEYTRIEAPIAGRIGKSAVTDGNLVGPNSGTMATLIQLDPIRVAFALPDRLYTQFVEEIGDTPDAEARALFSPSVRLPNGRAYEEPGRIAFVANEIDQATGTITVYAEFANPTRILLPGMFVVVTVTRSQGVEEPTVPASAVLRDRDGPYVFVVGQGNVATVRRITIDEMRADRVAVADGLVEGETVIVSGVQKVVPGAPVQPVPASADGTATTTAAASAATE